MQSARSHLHYLAETFTIRSQHICVTIVGDAQECNYLLRLKQQHLVRIREQRHKLLDEIPRVYYKHQVSKISSA